MNYRKRWGTAEVAEYEDAVRDALLARHTDERTRRFIDAIHDAIQAHRPWAREVLDDMIYRGAASVLRAEERKMHGSTVEYKRGRQDHQRAPHPRREAAGRQRARGLRPIALRRHDHGRTDPQGRGVP